LWQIIMLAKLGRPGVYIMAPDVPYEDTCPRCSSYVSEYWRYCPYCQAVLYVVCPECGKEVALYWGGCPSCGVDVARIDEEDCLDASAFPCPVCSRYTASGVGACIHCGVQLVWLEGIPYKNTEFPSLSEQIPRRITDVSECPLCGDIVRDNWKACPKCGKSLHEIV